MGEEEHETHEADWKQSKVQAEALTGRVQVFKVTVPIDSKSTNDWSVEFRSAARSLEPYTQGAEVIDLTLQGSTISVRTTRSQIESGGVRGFIDQAVEAANHGIVHTAKQRAELERRSREIESALDEQAAELQAKLRNQ